MLPSLAASYRNILKQVGRWRTGREFTVSDRGGPHQGGPAGHPHEVQLHLFRFTQNLGSPQGSQGNQLLHKRLPGNSPDGGQGDLSFVCFISSQPPQNAVFNEPTDEMVVVKDIEMFRYSPSCSSSP